MNSGIADTIFKAAMANVKAIEGCAGPHEFVREDNTHSRCKKCGGVASVASIHWYKAGLRHGAKDAAQR